MESKVNHPVIDLVNTPNSFHIDIDDWQNIKDVQKFFKDKWDEADNSVRFVPTFRGYNNTDVKVEVKAAADKSIVETVAVRTRALPGKEIEMKISPKDVTLRWDNGFRRSLTYNFNPFYRLVLHRSPLGFKELALGLNFNAEDGCTHHEFAVQNIDEEMKFQLKNSYMTTWRFLKYGSNSLIRYGSKIESSQTHTISIDLHRDFCIYAILDQMVNKEMIYNGGIRYTPFSSLNLFLNNQFTSKLDVSTAFGFSYSNPSGIEGKVAVTEFQRFGAYLGYLYKPWALKASLVFKHTLSQALINPQGTRIDKADTKLGFKIEVDV